MVVVGRFRAEESTGDISSKDMLSLSSLTVVVAIGMELGITTGNIGGEGCFVRAVVGGRSITDRVSVVEFLRVVRGKSKSNTELNLGVVGVGIFVVRAIIVVWVANMLMENPSVEKYIVIDSLWNFSVLSSWDISVESFLNCIIDSLWNLSLSNFLLNIVGFSCFLSISGYWYLFI